MSLRTSAGIAQVRHLSRAFDLSRAALYKAAHAEDVATPTPRQTPQPVLSDERLLGEIAKITAEQQAWGHRKVWAMLRRREIIAGRRRVWKLMHAAGMTFAPAARRCEPRRGTVIVPEPNRRWSTDMTTIWTRDDGWVALTPVIDNGCRTLFEIGVSKAQDAPAILAPLEAALRAEFGDPHVVPDAFELRSDHGSVYTGSDCETLCDTWKINHTFAPVGRPTGNAVAERVIQTMKIELLWLRDWENRAEVEVATEAWRTFYNAERPHEALGWQTPTERRAERLNVEVATVPDTVVENVDPTQDAETSCHNDDRALPVAA